MTGSDRPARSTHQRASTAGLNGQAAATTDTSPLQPRTRRMSRLPTQKISKYSPLVTETAAWQGWITHAAQERQGARGRTSEVWPLFYQLKHTIEGAGHLFHRPCAKNLQNFFGIGPEPSAAPMKTQETRGDSTATTHCKDAAASASGDNDGAGSFFELPLRSFRFARRTEAESPREVAIPAPMIPGRKRRRNARCSAATPP